MSYLVFGLNHETAPVSVREAFELPDETLTRLYECVRLPKGSEWMVLSTCNRTEVYLHGTRNDLKTIRWAIETECGPWPAACGFEYEGMAAVTHVIEVIAGLRSQILGDGQILSQAKNAYRLAVRANILGPLMHRLVHAAFTAAKHTVTETGLGLYGASVARSAVQTALHHLPGGRPSENRLTALVLGGGHMGSLLIRELATHSPLTCTVANRTREIARHLASKFDFEDIDWDDRLSCTASVDLVFVTTGAPDYVLTRAQLASLSPGIKEKKTLLVDIAVPRNVDPTIADLPGFDVLNIDGLEGPRGRDASHLSTDLADARAICQEAVDGIINWSDTHTAVQPAIQTLHDTFEAIRKREFDRNIHRIAESEHEDVERLTRSIMQKLLAIPIVHLKTMASNDIDFSSRISFLNQVFDRSQCEDVKGQEKNDHSVEEQRQLSVQD